MPFRVSPAALLLTLALAALPAAGQNGDKDLNELEHYTLTMDNVTRWYESLHDLGEAAKTHPSLKGKLETDADKHEDFAQIDQRIASEPVIVSTLKAHGFTPHTFTLTEFAFIQSGLASAMKPANENSADYAAKVHINPANLDFIAAHKDELTALAKKYKSSDSND